MASNTNHSFISVEDEIEILNRFKACTQHELMLAETILRYMTIYQSGFELERTGDAQGAQNYFIQLHAMPDDVELKKTAWLNSIDAIYKLGNLIQFMEEQSPPSTAQLQSEEKQTENSLNSDFSSFERLVRNNISTLNQMIDNWQHVKLNGSQHLSNAQTEAWRETKIQWQAILDLRKTLIEMGGKDFFELFDHLILNEDKSHA